MARGRTGRGASALMVVVGAGLTALGWGCSNGPAVVEPTRYDGPRVSLDSDARNHIVVLTAPNPGWDIELDRVRQRRGTREVFVTVQRPNPEFMYPQQIVEKRVATDIASSEPVRINARTLDFDQDNGAGYAPVAGVGAEEEAAGRPPGSGAGTDASNGDAPGNGNGD